MRAAEPVSCEAVRGGERAVVWSPIGVSCACFHCRHSYRRGTLAPISRQLCTGWRSDDGRGFWWFSCLQHPVLLSLGPPRAHPTPPQTPGPWGLVPAGLVLGAGASVALLQLCHRRSLEMHFWTNPWALKARSWRGGAGKDSPGCPQVLALYPVCR